MYGSPLRQWFCFVIVWLLLLYPILRVTHDSTSNAAPEAISNGEKETAWITLRFSSEVERFELRQNDSPVWVEDNPDGNIFEHQCSLVFDPQGVEVVLWATVPETTTAVEVLIESDGRAAGSKTVWGSGKLNERIDFSWENNE